MMCGRALATKLTPQGGRDIYPGLPYLTLTLITPTGLHPSQHLFTVDNS